MDIPVERTRFHLRAAGLISVATASREAVDLARRKDLSRDDANIGSREAEPGTQED